MKKRRIELDLWELNLIYRFRALRNKSDHGIIVVQWLSDGTVMLRVNETKVETLRPGTGTRQGT